MPAHFASQALPYVFPSQPQTGTYSFVHIQSAMAVPLQADIFLVQDEVMPIRMINAENKYFIQINLNSFNRLEHLQEHN
ncbi:MAG TPA: hypothetical protein VMY77_14270 [Chitinophagaceae bacterium]|nr:hypothetical protein [Chitinophagaceae bacterium]